MMDQMLFLMKSKSTVRVIFKIRRLVFLAALFTLASSLLAQTGPITRQEMLRGTITPEREWWDVLHYDLSVQFFPDTRTIKGSNTITFRTLKSGQKMQIDLQQPLNITNILFRGAVVKYEREGNVYWVSFDKEVPA